MDLVVSSASCKIQGWQDRRQPLCQHRLPSPRGPIKMTLCPPAAAISNALLIFSCPWHLQNIFILIQPRINSSGVDNHPLQFPVSLKIDDLPDIFHSINFQLSYDGSLFGILQWKNNPLNPFRLPRLRWEVRLSSAAGFPSRDNSPRIMKDSSFSIFTTLSAARIATAMVRSYDEPLFSDILPAPCLWRSSSGDLVSRVRRAESIRWCFPLPRYLATRP